MVYDTMSKSFAACRFPNEALSGGRSSSAFIFGHTFFS